MDRVLLTSFEPFGGHALNSSLEVGRAVAEQPPAGIALDWLVLPVVAGRCVELAWERVEELRPALVLALGQAGKRACVHVEQQAANLHDFDIPDNGGQQPRGQPIRPGGPHVYLSSIPVERVVSALAGHGIPAERSTSAGTYVCNHLLYGLLHHSAERGGVHQTGFLHLPLLPCQHKEPPADALTLEQLAEAVRIAIRTCLDARSEPASVKWPHACESR